MLSFLPAFLRGTLATLLLALNTICCASVLFLLALVKLLPIPTLQKRCTIIMISVAELWMRCNSGWMALTGRTRWEIEGLEQLDYRGWYLVTSNHQSWVDIIALQHVLNRRMPMLKFFLK
ncbi:MAG: acyltransferase, partial [Pseudomonas neustonica]